jgi:hypothetical protein
MNDVLIDRVTGKLKIISRNWEFGPDLTLENFQAAESSKSANRISKISPHYKLRTVLASGWHCGLILMFVNNSLNEVLLGFSEKELDWSDWSKEGELRRKERHDGFLREQLGPPPYVFGWGRVMSVIDPHNSTAHITIRYI